MTPVFINAIFGCEKDERKKRVKGKQREEKMERKIGEFYIFYFILQIFQMEKS